MKMKLNKAQQELVSKIIDSLEKDDLIWRKGWQSMHGDRPYNLKSNHSYSGMNLFILTLESLENDYVDPRWMTFQQAKEAGYNVKKGSKSTTLSYYSLYDPEEKKVISKSEYMQMDILERPRIKSINKCFSVFNAEQIEGIDLLERKENNTLLTNSIATTFIDKLQEELKINVVHSGDSASYYPTLDKIVMPSINAFESEDGYYSTLLHEFSHATAHESRLNRELETFDKKSNEYAKEELIAEISSAFLSIDLEMDISNIQDNNIAYCQSWAKQIKEDPQYLFRCITEAQKAYTYLLEKGKFNLIKANHINLNQQLATNNLKATSKELVM